MSGAPTQVFIGLGSNLEQPAQQIRRALRELRELPDSRLVRHSALYGSTALGPSGQPDYVNAVALLQTGLDPLALLDRLQAIEQDHGRQRGARWGPRTLDLDILLYGDRQIASPRLRVPHPQMHRRAFVLAPLYEIAPDIDLPGLGRLQNYVSAPGDPDVWRLRQERCE